ncbi:hypothetical protein [Afipia carboxidovorans]|uniref:hypothetical protein n=1 Tax=Afipia carboxidovorans TaxID=40137 RepID=UPI003090EC0C|nr:hypothetical protein CRBSH125_06050 [Afipia carboxidovorans]
MPLPAQLIRQRDFSGGELVEYAKRGDDLGIVRGGARRALNWRILNTRSLEQRPGRDVLFPEPGRSDEVRMNSGSIFRLCFGNGTLRIRDADGAVVAASGGYPWTIATRGKIVWTVVNFDVVICFPGMRPKIARWDGISTWVFLDYAFKVGTDGLPRVPFYRLATKGITMVPSTISGNIVVTFSADVLKPAHVGVVFQWANRKLQITSVINARNANATVLETLLICQRLTLPAGNELGFSVGDSVVGSVTNANGVVVQVDTTNHYVYVQNLTLVTGFSASDTMVGPNGRSTVSAPTLTSPQPIAVWLEQAISDARGWPQSVSTDNNRLIFCDLPGLPEGIIWSAVGVPDDLQVGVEGTDAFMELMTGKPRIYHVIGGQDEFVFTNKGVRYIPISASNPLRPGSVQFLQITPDAASDIRPVPTAEGVLFLNEGRNRIIALLQTGQNTAPYTTQDVSEFHAHLIKEPITIATSTGDGEFPERYVYVLNSDGTMAVGRYQRAKEWIGFVPWNSPGFLEWVSVLSSRVLITTRYDNVSGLSADTTAESADDVDHSADLDLPNDHGSYRLVEMVTASAYLDSAVSINSIPAALAAGSDPVFPLFLTAGAVIGNMTGNGGTAAPSDGVTSKAAAASAAFTGTAGYWGRDLPVSLPIGGVDVWPSSDKGFRDGITGSVMLQLRGSNTLPASSTDGTLLGTLSTANVMAGPLRINSNDLATAYRYWWVRISNGSATAIYLAAAQFYVAGQVRASITGATGPLWFMAGQTVDLIDGYNLLGTRAVNLAGSLVPEEGEDLSGSRLTVGRTFTCIFEPFVPHPEGGQDAGQTTRKRGVKRVVITTQRATGYTFGKRRVPPWRQGDNQSLAPPLREETQTFKPLGHAVDPRNVLVKDTPGPLRLLEIGHEVTV